MTKPFINPAPLEDLRESGDYEKLASMMNYDWQITPEFEVEAIRLRLLVAELHGRAGRLEEMETALAPYLEDVNRVPFGLAARVLLMSAIYHYRRSEPTESLRLSLLARVVATARDDEFTMAEAVQQEGQALWSLERWEEAAARFEQAINLYGGQSRAYRLGIANLCLGSVLNRIGRVEEARTTLERGIKMLLKCHDEYNLAVARVNVALALNVIGEHETALKYLLFAHDTFKQMAHGQYTYLTLNSIATALISLKEYARAETYVAQALEVGTAARSTQIAATYEIKGKLHLARREWTEAERALDTALEIAEQANSQSQKAEASRTLARVYLAQDREAEAAKILWPALDIAFDLRASLLEMEIKALLAQAVCATNPVEACRMLSDVEAELGDRPLPELRKDALAARKRISALDQEQYFILSDGTIPLLADAKVALLKWLWARALYKAKGSARDAAGILGVTPTYIRKLTKIIPRDLLRPGKKRQKKRAGRDFE
jgi:tetratricopeptide (TPR) repeat protein